VEQVLTVACKLDVPDEVKLHLDETLQAFADACIWINESVDPKMTSNLRIQTLVYQDVRAKFGLSANLTVRAINRVAANRKTAKKERKPVKAFAPTSVDYDARIFSFREKNWTVSLTLMGGRRRLDLSIGNYQRHLLAGSKPTSATLCKRADGSYYIHIQVKSEPPPERNSDDVIGVDLGRTDIAATSDGEQFCGQQLKQVRDHFAKTRASIQKKASKGTRSSRRRCRQLLKRLSGKERRFQSWVNHTISRKLVRDAVAQNRAIALEDLTGIRERTNQQPRSKTERRRSNSWAFYQLRLFLAYKCLGSGVKLILVNPAYTSRTCSECSHIHPGRDESYRSGKRFRCGHCGWLGDADLNGAKNIQTLGRLVNSPEGPGWACSLADHVRLRAIESQLRTA
jgi:IS605 OrfB family transposase